MSSRWKQVCIYLTGFVCVSAMAGTAQANRRVSLAANLLVEDKEDVYLYPQRLLDYRNMVGVDMGGDARSGRLMYLGGWETLGLGISAYGETAPSFLFAGPLAPDLLSYESRALYLGQATNPYGLYSVGSLWPEGAPPIVVDGFLAVPLGLADFGVRMGLATQGSVATDDDTDTGVEETLVALEAGLSGGAHVRFDTSLSVLLDFARGVNTELRHPAMAEVQVPEEYRDWVETYYEDISATVIRTSLSGRLFLPFADRIDVGMLGNIALATGLMESEPDDTDPFTGDRLEDSSGHNFGLGVMGGVGPVFHVTERTTMAGYAVVGMSYASSEPNDEQADDEIKDLVVWLPGVRLAAEIGLVDWFFVRGGMQYSFQLASSSLNENSFSRFVLADPARRTNPDTLNERQGIFSWSAGVGFEHEGFTLDATLKQEWLTEGPDFIGGGDQTDVSLTDAGFQFRERSVPLLAVLSAAYHWL